MICELSSIQPQLEFSTDVRWLGQTQYEPVFSLQKDLGLQMTAKDPSQSLSDKIYILGTEHEAVVTLGQRASESEEVHATCQLPRVRVDRGGLATLHSPGQLVIYPIRNIRSVGIGVKEWVCTLIEVSKRTLREFGLQEMSSAEDGVYTEFGKIVSIGLRVSNGVSYHGLALNISNSLELFDGIRACGVAGRKMDRLQRVQSVCNPEEVFRVWVREFIDFHNPKV